MILFLGAWVNSQGLYKPVTPISGMTKIKMSKEESTSADFLERRRAALERYRKNKKFRIYWHESA